jgi:hypothetical protein
MQAARPPAREKAVSKKLTLNDLQSDGGLFSPSINPPSIIREEHRQSDRKPLRTNGTVNLNGAEVPFTTLDISLGGLSIRSPSQLVVGNEYSLRFDLDADGSVRNFAVGAEAIYWFHTSEGDYKTGLKFLNPAPELEAAIRQFVDTPGS